MSIQDIVNETVEQETEKTRKRILNLELALSQAIAAESIRGETELLKYMESVLQGDFE